MNLRRALIALAMVVALGACAVQAGAAGGGSTERVSVGSDGRQADGGSTAMDVSAHGRFVLFGSFARNLGVRQRFGLFLRDRRAKTTRLVSGDLDTGGGDLSSDGRVVLFRAPTANGCDRLYLRAPGGRIKQVPVGRHDAEPSKIFVWASALSPDGRYAVFVTHRDAYGTRCRDIPERQDGVVTWAGARLMLFDRRSGRTRRVRVPGVVTTRSEVAQVAVSRNARVIVLNKLRGDVERHPGVFAFDRHTHKRRRVDVNSRERRPAKAEATEIDVSANGRYVAFQSHAHFTRGDSGDDGDIFVRDLRRGRTTRVSVAGNGQGVGDARFPSLSASGRYVSFEAMKPNDLDNGASIYVRDRRRHRTAAGSVDMSGRRAGRSALGVLSADGRTVVFTSAATNLVPGDTNGFEDAFARRLRRR